VTAFSIGAADLYAALTNVLPHTESTGVLPALCAIHISLDNHTVTFAATDRYTLAVHEIDLHGEDDFAPGEFLLPAADARNIAKIAKATKIGDVDIVHELGTLIVKTRQTTVTVLTLDGTFPKYRSLIPDGTGKGKVSVIGFGGKHLAKFGKMYDGFSQVTTPNLKLTMTAADRPVLITPAWAERDNSRFRAVIMTVRLIDEPAVAAA